MTLRSGITTGACAAAAAKAAAIVLDGGSAPREVELTLPAGGALRVPIRSIEATPDGSRAVAIVQKDAGDDVDVTHGMDIVVTVWWNDAPGVQFLAGEGVGVVTLPGLQVPPGEPAINPVPRRMIAEALAKVTSRGLCVEIAIPGGREVAARTFNPRLGITGGLSILGTTGIVLPRCTRALQSALLCSLDVVRACHIKTPILVPGNLGARAARKHFRVQSDPQILEAGNQWGFLVDRLPWYGFEAVLVVGHPGKLVKLAADQWDTHSAHSERPTEILDRLAREILGLTLPDYPTTEGILLALEPPIRKRLGDDLAKRIGQAISRRLGSSGKIPLSECQALAEPVTHTVAKSAAPECTEELSDCPARNGVGCPLPEVERRGTLKLCAGVAEVETPGLPAVAVLLVDMAGESLGSDGDASRWQQ